MHTIQREKKMALHLAINLARNLFVTSLFLFVIQSALAQIPMRILGALLSLGAQ